MLPHVWNTFTKMNSSALFLNFELRGICVYHQNLNTYPVPGKPCRFLALPEVPLHRLCTPQPCILHPLLICSLSFFSPDGLLIPIYAKNHVHDNMACLCQPC